MGRPTCGGSGSGNIGATNVATYGGANTGTIDIIGRQCKGLRGGTWWRNGWGDSLAATALAALAAILGHMFPVYYRFRGGKGVARRWE